MTTPLLLRFGIDDDSAANRSRIVAGLGQIERAMTAINRPLGVLERGLAGLGRGFGAVTRTVFSLKGALVGLGIGLGFREITRTVAGFSQEMGRVQAITNATEGDFQRLRRTARELGATTEFSATQAAEGLAALGMAGLNANQSIAAIPGTLDLATAGQLGLAEATEIVVGIMGAYRMEAGKAGKVGDVLAKVATNAQTDVRALGDAMGYAAPVTASLGISVEETAAAIGVLGDAAIGGQRAGTALRAILARLTNPASEVAEALESLGIAAEEVNPATHSMTEIFQRFNEAGLDAARASKIFGTEALAAGLVLTRSVDRLGELTAMAEASDGSLTKMAGTMRNTLGGSMLTMRSAAEDLQLSLGDAGLEGAARQLVETMTILLNRAAKSESLGALAAGANEAAAAIKELLTGSSDDAREFQETLDGLAPSVSQVVGWMGNIAKAAVLVAAAIADIGASMKLVYLGAKVPFDAIMALMTNLEVIAKAVGIALYSEIVGAFNKLEIEVRRQILFLARDIQDLLTRMGRTSLAAGMTPAIERMEYGFTKARHEAQQFEESARLAFESAKAGLDQESWDRPRQSLAAFNDQLAGMALNGSKLGTVISEVFPRIDALTAKIADASRPVVEMVADAEESLPEIVTGTDAVAENMGRVAKFSEKTMESLAATEAIIGRIQEKTMAEGLSALSRIGGGSLATGLGTAASFGQDVSDADAQRADLEEQLKSVQEGSDEYLAIRDKMRQLDTARHEAYTQQMLAVTSGFTGGAADLFAAMYEATGKRHKAFLVAWKAFAIVETIVNTYKAAMAAYASAAAIPVVGFVLGPAAAAAAVAFGMAQVAAIASAQVPTMHTGGPVTMTAADRRGLAPDEVHRVLQTGEGVLSRRGMAALDRLNSGGGMVGGGAASPVIVEIVNVDSDERIRNRARDLMASPEGRTIIVNQFADDFERNGASRHVIKRGV